MVYFILSEIPLFADHLCRLDDNETSPRKEPRMKTGKVRSVNIPEYFSYIHAA
jgi:hypothetical protein